MSLIQLALPFADYGGTTDQGFLEAPSNAEARAWLERVEAWPGGRLVIWGEPGCGKSHLLRRWAADTRAALVAGAALHGPSEPTLTGLAIDDADRVADDASLLHTLNAAAEAGFPVLLSACAPPARWSVRLPDLMSRLRTITAVAITAPEEWLLKALLAQQFAERQLAVPEPVQDWILLRLPRTAAAVHEFATRLDQAALAGGRAVNRMLAASVLAGFDENGQAPLG
jgi:chromosomal replication initiation ATPase DnaA